MPNPGSSSSILTRDRKRSPRRGGPRYNSNVCLEVNERRAAFGVRWARVKEKWAQGNERLSPDSQKGGGLYLHGDRRKELKGREKILI